MTDFDAWLLDNDRYLALALGWIRARLSRLADSELATPGTLEARALADVPLPEEMQSAEAAERPPALLLLAQRLGLSDFERYTLLLCAAMELDTRMGELCARAQRDPARTFPTFALALALFDDPAWDVLSPERPLRHWRLIEINQPGGQPLIGSALKADERIVNYLKGLNYLDDRLTPLFNVVPLDDVELPPSQAELATRIGDEVRRLKKARSLPIFQLVGPDGESKSMVARQAAASMGRLLYRLPADALPSGNADLQTFARLWQRESALMPIALYLDASQLDRAAGAHSAALRRLLASGLGLVFLDTREPWSELIKESVLLDVTKPTPSEQRGAWLQALGSDARDHAARLAAQFNFNLPTIRAVASASVDVEPERLGGALWSNALSRSRPSLDQLAQPLRAKATWDDIELAAEERSVLRQIAEQVRSRGAVYDDWGFRKRMNRGFGISVLFAGESGTGKTMAAEVIANDLQLLLYRIDLSAVVSKYIGETEKNLRKLFDVAEDGGAILFFDEADALFGRRSEVKDSHDRYANIEVNYLLQRMEEYRGLAILATNMKASLDSAFLRRLRFIVNFPFPSVAARKGIWQKTFPPETPRAALDYERLAKFNLTGGSIYNIALNAAFLASRGAGKVTMALVLEAMRTEFRKLERPINEAEFRWLEPVEAGS